MILHQVTGVAKLTSQERPDVDAGGGAARATIDQQQDGDISGKSYRYVRTAMVALLVCLAAAVVYQSWRQGDLLGSVSAYYYTPAQAIFVGALIGLGACMIALKGTTAVEDIFLNLGGVFAAVVAIVPTARDADYRAAVRACEEADTPLLTERASTELDCPTVQALADATRANVENNLSALLVVGAVALLAALFFARQDGTLRGHGGTRRLRNFAWGFGVASVLWLAGLVVRFRSLQWFVDNAHFVAAAGLFLCILVVALVNARRVEGEPADDVPRVQQSAEAVGALVTPRRQDRYIWIARLMVLVAVGSIVVKLADFITLFWLEIAVAALFIAFWIAQTLDLERARTQRVG
jgi:hypothetical protein